MRSLANISADALANKCPSRLQLTSALRLLSSRKNIIVFSNDVENVKHEFVEFNATYIHPGDVIELHDDRQGSQEARPIEHELIARDFAALTQCEDLMTTCGSFGGFAAALHAGGPVEAAAGGP